MTMYVPELWDSIVEYLSSSDMIRLASVSRFFRLLCKKERHWKRFTAKYLPSNSPLEETGFPTYFELFNKLLRNHGFLLGLWHSDQTVGFPTIQGALMEGKIKERAIVLSNIEARVQGDTEFGQLVEWRLTDLEPVLEPLFKVNEKGRIVELSGSGMGLELTPDKRFKIVLEDRSGTVLFTKFLHKEVRRHPLEGLWAGLYGPHGVEFLAVTYVSKEKEIVDPFPMQDHVARPAFPGDYLRGFKLTGDPNIYAGKTTFYADLSAPKPVPNMRINIEKGAAAYSAFLQVANHQYSGPSLTPAVFLEPEGIEKDHFYLFWTALHVLTKYQRFEV